MVLLDNSDEPDSGVFLKHRFWQLISRVLVPPFKHQFDEILSVSERTVVSKGFSVVNVKSLISYFIHWLASLPKGFTETPFDLCQ